MVNNTAKYLVVLGHYGHMGGAERQAFHFVRYLRQELGARVAVLGWYGKEGPLAHSLREMGCDVYSFPYKEKAPPLSKAINLLQLAAFIRTKIRPDVILPFVSIHSKPICQIWKLTGARYAWWNQQDEGRGLHGTKAERKALLNACHITSNSLAGTEFLSKTYNIPREKILTYNNGTVLPDLAAIRPIWRQQLGLTEETRLVSMAANITPFKDHETLLRAWKIVLSEFSRISLPAPVLALAGHTRDNNHVQGLKALAFDLELGASVKFLGAIETTDALMFESDLVVHSSVKEGCPNAVCEAMALGKAVVGTDIPGMRQALDSLLWEKCLASAGDAPALAAALMRLLQDQELSHGMGAANRQRIAAEFSNEGMCRFFCSLIDPDSFDCRLR